MSIFYYESMIDSTVKAFVIITFFGPLAHDYQNTSQDLIGLRIYILFLSLTLTVTVIIPH